MTDRDDHLRDRYLWERDGEPDPAIEQLERLLASQAHDGRDLPLDALPAQQRAPAPRRSPWLLAAAAAMVCIAVAAWLLWESRPNAELELGERDVPRSFASIKAPLELRLGELATLTLRPGSEVRFEHWRQDQALFSLLHGTIEARVAPPPKVQAGFFQVATALGRVIDQGCRFELSHETADRVLVAVTEGAVTFEFPQRTVFVPAQASTTVADTGPSTPLFDDCPDALRKVVRQYDELVEKSRFVKGEGAAMRRKGLDVVAQYCGKPRDSLPLWHMLLDDDETVREDAEKALLDLVGPPEDLETKDRHWEPEVWLAFLRLKAWQPN